MAAFYNQGDQAIYQGGQHFIPQEKYRLGYYPPVMEEEQLTTATGVGIPYTNAFNNSGVGGGITGNPASYEQTWTREREPVIDNSIRVQSLAPADAPKGYYDNSIEGQLDYTIDAPPKIFDLEQNTGILQSLKDKFFKPRYRGELGDRLKSQYETGQKLPSWIAAMAGLQSPFNIDSKNYNPNMADQLNFLEMQDNYIGRDPQSGLYKYGPESVLAGQNVFSGFGSNNYEEQLEKKKAWFERRMLAGKKFSKDKYQQTLDEISALKTEQKSDPTTTVAKTITPQHHQDVSQGGAGGGDTHAAHTAKNIRSEKQEGIDTRGSALHGGKHYAEGGRIGLKEGGRNFMGDYDPGNTTGWQESGQVETWNPGGGGTTTTSFEGGQGDGNNQNNFTLDSNLISTAPSMELMYSPLELATLRARLYNKDLTTTDDINFEGALSGGNNLIDYGIDFTDEGITGGNVGLNYGDLNLRATTDLDRHNLGVNYNKGPFFVGGNIDNMGNWNAQTGVKWEFGQPKQPVNALSYDDLIYGQNLRHGGLAGIL